MLHGEVDSALGELDRLAGELRELLLPKDPNAGRAVIVEIRGAEGGEEANLFAGDLYNMYLAYAARRRWKVETLAHDPSERGGVNQVTFVVRGDDAWQRLKFEGGPHRVQRVPVTESQGRIHTSSATVAVLPGQRVDIQSRKDLASTCTGRRAPAAHVNTTESAVRITTCRQGGGEMQTATRSRTRRAMQVLRPVCKRNKPRPTPSTQTNQGENCGVAAARRSAPQLKGEKGHDHRSGSRASSTDGRGGELTRIDPYHDEERTRQLAASTADIIVSDPRARTTIDHGGWGSVA